jgi:hypothetical protein
MMAGDSDAPLLIVGSQRSALCLKSLDQLFPNCQVVRVINDRRDVVASDRDRSDLISTVKASRRWSLSIGAAQTVGVRLPAGRYTEVRYESLLGGTEATVHKLLDFLGEPWDDAILKYGKKPRDVRPHRRAAVWEQGPVYRAWIGVCRRELHSLLRLLTGLVAGRRLREFGYRLGVP